MGESPTPNLGDRGCPLCLNHWPFLQKVFPPVYTISSHLPSWPSSVNVSWRSSSFSGEVSVGTLHVFPLFWVNCEMYRISVEYDRTCGWTLPSKSLFATSTMTYLGYLKPWQRSGKSCIHDGIHHSIGQTQTRLKTFLARKHHKIIKKILHVRL